MPCMSIEFVKSRIRDWGIEVDPLCSFCRTSVEDDFHLIFGCCFSQFVWRYMLRCIGFTRGALRDWDWDFETSWCINHFQQGDSLAHSIYRLVFNACIYHLWYECNKRVFNSTFSTEMQVISRITQDIRLKLAGQNLWTEDSNKNRQLFNRWGINIDFLPPHVRTCT
ncbi:hypothetical protein BVC80_1321g21 [Macleaya cordata]|uniref:Reverse transcriptase zinc-binding domain-containing protein n=1 Tax=Macleaya cordata TaxID=56857 RepID=A0A200Q0A8_MACCD|nr:hypothetical protein BVC80_1321g21 [Macleaya cordata]